MKISSCLRMPVAPSTPRSLPIWVSWEMLISLRARMSSASTELPFSAWFCCGLAMSFLFDSFADHLALASRWGAMAPQSSLIPFSRARGNRDDGDRLLQAQRLRGCRATRQRPPAAGDLVDLGGGHDDRRLPGSDRYSYACTSSGVAPTLPSTSSTTELRRRLPEIALDPRRPLPPRVLAGLGVAVARQVDEVEAPVHQEVVDRLRPSRRRAGAGEPLASQQPVQQARLADVGAPDESDLGTPVAQEVAAPRERTGRTPRSRPSRAPPASSESPRCRPA